MREHIARLLVVLLFLGAAGARADNSLHGLEMDVMDSGESAAQATARIALPRIAASMADAPDFPAVEADQSGRAGSTAREGLGVGPAFGIDAMEPNPDTSVSDTDIAKPDIDPGGLDGTPEEPIEETPATTP